MKYFLFIVLFFAMFFTISVKAQIEKVIIETYYVSDTNDATDTTDGRTLDAGSKTYRIYIDLKRGCKLKKIYGDANHTLRISSTANFFNNIDRPNAYFAYLVNKTWFSSNPTITLDSWLTIGLATKSHQGVLKEEDTDGSIVGGANNNGGSFAVPGGLLVNADASAGIPLTASDGLVPNNLVLSSWSDNGFRDGTGIDTTIFGSVNTGSQFISNTAFLLQNSGIPGASPDSNKVLIAQLTTKGDISFELNVEVIDSIGKSTKYIAKGKDTLDEKVSPYLTYPPLCGCKDPNYIEYDSKYACNSPGACKTAVVFGCMDPQACNFDPNANFNVQDLCCYPGYCKDRDISLVCPTIGVNELNVSTGFELYPDPVQDQLSVKILFAGNRQTKYELYDGFGRLLLEKNIGVVPVNTVEQLDVSGLADGIYMLRLSAAGVSAVKKIIKN